MDNSFLALMQIQLDKQCMRMRQELRFGPLDKGSRWWLQLMLRMFQHYKGNRRNMQSMSHRNNQENMEYIGS